MRKFTTAIIISLACMSAMPVAGQITWGDPPRPVASPAPPTPRFPLEKPMAEEVPPPDEFYGGDSSERSIKVDPNINISLCVTSGNVKVNGWDRNEVRVFVNDGSKFAFKVLQKGTKSGEPVWIMVVADNAKQRQHAPSECIWGGEIEIDAPVDTTINIKGQETTTNIDKVKRVTINTIGGDISLRNVTDGVTAYAGQGDITVEGSQGAMMLDSTTGNILVFEVGPREIGDTFKAKTNSGSISLQKLEHRQIEVNSITGSVVYNGAILNGGAYSIGTSKGSIKLSLPASTSCKISATYGYGTFATEIPVKILTENIMEGPIKSVVGTLGEGGDATLRITATNGSIGIKKKE